MYIITEYLLPLLPLVLTILVIWQRSSRKNPRTVGYVSNASSLVVFTFVATLASYIISPLVTKILGNDPTLIFKAWFLVLLTMVYFVCYAIIAFKPISSKDVDTIEESGGHYYDLATSASAGIGGMIAATFGAIWGIVKYSLDPRHIISETKSTITYRQKTGTESFLSITYGIVIVIFLIIALALVAYYFVLIAALLAWAFSIIKFFKNSFLYRNGPRDN